MVERQPGRPTVDEFTGAALRFIEDDYPLMPVHASAGMYMNVHQVKIGRDADIATLRKEIEADGIPGVRPSMRDFAIKQLAFYQKHRKV